jgi:ABC-2 type transport system permease protein
MKLNRIFSSAFVIARRDFTATVMSKAFLLFLLGPLFPVLMGGAFVSIGLLISSTTSNQIVAGVVTFVVFLLFWIIGWFADTAGPTIGPITSWLSITEHFDDFSKGIIDTKHVLYYLSLITFGLFLTAKSVDTERWRG